MTHDEAMALIEEAGLQGPTHGDLDGVKKLLEGRDDLVEAMNAADFRKVDELPQHAAAHCKAGEILEYLLQKGVKLDVFMAAGSGKVDDLKMLLDADPRLATANGAHGISLADHALNEQRQRLLKMPEPGPKNKKAPVANHPLQPIISARTARIDAG